MSGSILDKIRSNHKRTVVPSREDVLIAPKQGSEHITQQSSLANQASKETTDSTNSTLEELKAEIAKIPPTPRHSAIVLDAEIDANLTRFCKEKGVTVEVFLGLAE
jgi:tagatose-1,6-bisphosphate aldolase